LVSLGAGTGTNRTRVLAADFWYTPSGNSMWKWMFRFSAEPNGHMKVIAPVAAYALITVSGGMKPARDPNSGQCARVWPRRGC
jgi:hypothetical protein